MERKSKAAHSLPISYVGMACGSTAFWILVVNRAWERIPAMNYARHLFEAPEII